jgi:hypothetical protein
MRLFLQYGTNHGRQQWSTPEFQLRHSAPNAAVRAVAALTAPIPPHNTRASPLSRMLVKALGAAG